MTVDFAAAMGHYAAHLLPIWHALAPDLRGGWYVPSEVRPLLVAGGVPPQDIRGTRAPGSALTVVASAMDAIQLRSHRVVLVEHGAGQAYDDAPNPSFSGGPQRDNVALFLCPNEITARRNRDSYPGTAIEVVGSPHLDELMKRTAAPVAGVAVSFHWDCNLVPETRWAQPHYTRALPELARMGAIGHGHPRYRFVFQRLWKRYGLEHVPVFEDLVDRAWLYVCDNSSTLYEWAALDRPVVVLNAPWYRRDVDFWPRFWRCADVGIQVNQREELLDAIARALEDESEVAERRRQVVDEVFPLRDGRSAERSAHAIERALRLVRSPA